MTDLAELVVRIKADATQMQQEMARTTQTVTASSNQMSAAFGGLKSQLLSLAPAFSAVALVEFGKSAIDSTENLIHMADRIGFTTQTLSALEPTLKKNGSSVDEFATSVNFLNRNLGLAASGNAPALVKKFDELGLSVTKLMAMQPEDRFFAVAQAIGNSKDQATLAANAFLLMGRGVAGLLPTLKETGGNFDEVIKKAQGLGQVVSKEQEEQVRAFESAWVDMVTQMKIAMLDVMPVLNLYLAGIKAIVELPDEALNAGRAIGRAIKGNPNVSTTRPATVDTVTHDPKAISDALKTRGIEHTNPALGDNSDLLKGKDSALKDYIANLKQETNALGLNEKALFQVHAEIEATAKAKDDYNNGLRSSKSLTADEKYQVDALAGSYYELKKAQEETARQANQMKEAMSRSLTDIAFDFKSMGDSVKSVLDSIAKSIFKASIADPIASSLSKSISGSGIFSSIGKMFGGAFAEGGSPPVGVPSMVGENGPELFVPNSSGTIIPNNKIGGQSVYVNQQINLSPGLSETVNAAVMNAAPSIAAMAHAGVMQAIQKGGAESRIVGKRS